jgi:murein DD-endopeptidase MepM/ murein hydrolase activator NlpD
VKRRLALAAVAVVAGACSVGPPWREAIDGFAASVDRGGQELFTRLIAGARRAVAPPRPLALRRRRVGRGDPVFGAVVDVFRYRLDVRALPRGAAITAWTLGDALVAAEVERDGAPLLALLAGDDGVYRFFDDDGVALDGPFLARPVDGARVSSRFGPRPSPFTGQPTVHGGVDLAAPRGTVVVSAGDGVVSACAWQRGAGLHVVVKHPGGVVTRYFHLDRVADGIARGARVARGQDVGVVGATGRVTGPHLHFEVSRDGRRVDPLGEWPGGAPLPATSLPAHRALAAALRALPEGAEVTSWPPTTTVAPNS